MPSVQPRAAKAEARRVAIERRKNQILELRKMALEDRAARKANKRAQKSGLFDVDAEESGSESEDDDEIDAERQAIEELRAADYLDDIDVGDDNGDEHRQLAAKQDLEEHERYMASRGDMFDEDWVISEEQGEDEECDPEDFIKLGESC